MNTNTNIKLTTKATQAAMTKLSKFAASASTPKPTREFSKQQKTMLKVDEKKPMSFDPKFGIFQKKSLLNGSDQFTLLKKLQNKNATDF